jgi:hypothetical protein
MIRDRGRLQAHNKRAPRITDDSAAVSSLAFERGRKCMSGAVSRPVLQTAVRNFGGPDGPPKLRTAPAYLRYTWSNDVSVCYDVGPENTSVALIGYLVELPSFSGLTACTSVGWAISLE